MFLLTEIQTNPSVAIILNQNIRNVAKNSTKPPLKKLYVAELHETDQQFLAPKYDKSRQSMQRKRKKPALTVKFFEDI